MPLFGEPQLSPTQVFYTTLSQRLFIFYQLALPFLYYVPPFNRWCDGDGKDAKFPCSISWMCRKGLGYYIVFFTWVPGWMIMIYAFSVHEQRNILGPFMLSLAMFVCGVVTIIMFPITQDAAMGRNDTIHCLGASFYIVCHFFSAEWVFGVECFSGANLYGAGFTLSLIMCGICQGLRMNSNRAARYHYEVLSSWHLMPMTYNAYLYFLECVFLFSEYALFMIYLLGMLSGSATRPAR